MTNLINLLLHYTDEDILYDELKERYKRLCLSRLIFLSLFPLEEQKKMDQVFSLMNKEADEKNLTVTEQFVELCDPPNKFPYSRELKVVLVYLAYGNESLEKEVCTELQINKAKEFALGLVSDRIWELTTI